MTDWSKSGIGFVIFQQVCSCNSNTPKCCQDGWQLVFCGSRSLTASEINYAPIEGELLAVTWCLKKAMLFLHGCPQFTLLTDHKPLVPILTDKALASIENPCLLRMKEKTLQFSFRIQHIAGKEMYAADTFSRYPVFEDEEFANDVDVCTVRLVLLLVLSAQTMR